ncbi:MAG: M15 family metallopeptidase [Bacillaceae bacterium]
MKKNSFITYDDLAYIQVTYIDFNGDKQLGELIVNKQVADEIVAIFKELYSKRYPIAKITLIDEFNANDEQSMLANNTSAFCYRTIAKTNYLSNHAKGLAIDINPLQNPHVLNNQTFPATSFAYKNRSSIRQGMIVEGDDCYKAFISRGWTWGGDWKNPDYQHFEKVLN